MPSIEQVELYYRVISGWFLVHPVVLQKIQNLAFRFMNYKKYSTDQGQRTLGGRLDRIDVTLPPVFNPKIVPLSCSRLNST